MAGWARTGKAVRLMPEKLSRMLSTFGVNGPENRKKCDAGEIGLLGFMEWLRNSIAACFAKVKDFDAEY